MFTLILPFNATAQTTGKNFYYTANGKKVPLNFVTGEYAVQFKDTSQSLRKSKIGVKLTPTVYLVKDTTDLHLYFYDYSIMSGYKTKNEGLVYITNEIVMEFKESTSESEKSNLIRNNKLQFIKNSLSYTLYKCTGDALAISNSIFESGFVNFCTPNFIINMQPLDYYPSDPYFNKQYYLYNTGQLLNDGHYGTPGADIKAPKAWDITKGNSNVTVAVIDAGVTSNHSDLPNTRQIRLVGSNFAAPYDVSSPNDPSPVGDGNHGNACAGIVAATQDNEGIAGIAPLCKVMPVRIPFGFIPSSVYADAIDFANTNGADILTNSWGYNSSAIIPVIQTAIQNAVNDGEVVLFAAGNTADHVHGNDGFVTFPGSANVNDLITVGASDRNDNQANYSPTNSLVDITAPSHKAYPSQITGESFDIWTIDIPGNAGWNPWKDAGYNPPAVGEYLPSSGTHYLAYTGRMGGTSAATPEVAGVAALMLSVNHCLSPAQVKTVLLNTADKVGGYNYNWNSSQPGQSKELGYGRVDAYKAVKAAQELHSTALDLYMKDVPNDFGSEPASYGANTFLWISCEFGHVTKMTGLNNNRMWNMTLIIRHIFM